MLRKKPFHFHSCKEFMICKVLGTEECLELLMRSLALSSNSSVMVISKLSDPQVIFCYASCGLRSTKWMTIGANAMNQLFVCLNFGSVSQVNSDSGLSLAFKAWWISWLLWNELLQLLSQYLVSIQLVLPLPYTHFPNENCIESR